MVPKTQLSVNRLRAGVVPLDFEVQRADAALAAGFFGEFDCAPPEAPPPVGFHDVEFVEKGVNTTEFKAVSECDDRVTDDAFFFLYCPHDSMPRII